MPSIRAAAHLALLHKKADEMQRADLLRQSTTGMVPQQAEAPQMQEPEDPRLQQAEARLKESKVAQKEAKADGGDVAVATERQKAELSKEKLMLMEQQAENERMKLEIEGKKLEQEKQDIAQQEQQREAEMAAAAQQAEGAGMPQPENPMQQAALQQQQQALPKIAGSAPYYFGLPNLYSLNMFQSPARIGDTNRR